MFFSVVTASSIALGIEFTSRTLIVTKATELSPLESVTLYLKVTKPIKLDSGVYVIVLSAFLTAIPLTGASSTDTTIPPSSKPVSLNRTSTITAVFLLVPRLSAFAIGKSFTPVTVIFTEASSQLPPLSQTLYINVSPAPLYNPLGI